MQKILIDTSILFQRTKKVTWVEALEHYFVNFIFFQVMVQAAIYHPEGSETCIIHRILK